MESSQTRILHTPSSQAYGVLGRAVALYLRSTLISSIHFVSGLGGGAKLLQRCPHRSAMACDLPRLTYELAQKTPWSPLPKRGMRVELREQTFFGSQAIRRSSEDLTVMLFSGFADSASVTAVTSPFRGDRTPISLLSCFAALLCYCHRHRWCFVWRSAIDLTHGCDTQPWLRSNNDSTYDG